MDGTSTVLGTKNQGSHCSNLHMKEENSVQDSFQVTPQSAKDSDRHAADNPEAEISESSTSNFKDLPQQEAVHQKCISCV